jgi:hypothetical protein
MGQQGSVGGRTKAKAPSPERGQADEALLALEELVAAEKNPDNEEAHEEVLKKGKAEGESTAEELGALEALVAYDADEDSALDQLMAAGASPERKAAPEQKVRPPARRASQKPSGSPREGPGLDGGLSEDEKDDLERLIKGLRDEQLPGGNVAVVEGLQKQAEALQDRVVQLTKIIKKYDYRMKTYAEVLRLYNEKTELMNRRMDKIEDLIKGK